MNSSRIKVFPGSSYLGGLECLFDEIWGSVNDTVSHFPEGLVCGEFPPTNMLADEDENLVIQMSVAGYPEDGVDISYKDEYLVVTVTPDEHQFDKFKVKMKGIRNSKAQKKILVPAKDFDVNSSTATTEKGILTIKIPRKEEAKPILIPIKKM
jgi:HSP20 family molecular chaperone IbpA